jgi:hypothetical protein
VTICLIFDTFYNRIYLKLLCAFAALIMFSSPISTPVNAIGQTDVELAQDAELCDNIVDDDADGAIDRQDEDCSPQADEKQRQTAGAGKNK